jgi:hypothetical protein
MSDEIKSKTDKKNTAIGCVTVLIILIVIVAFAMHACSNGDTTPKASDTLSTAVDKGIHAANATKQSVEFNDDVGTSVAGDKVVLIHVKPANTARATILDNSCKLLKNLQNRKDVGQVTLFWTGTLVDTYGSKSEEQVVKLTLNKAKLDKINFDNFVYNDLPGIADSYWEHRAMTKEKK